MPWLRAISCAKTNVNMLAQDILLRFTSGSFKYFYVTGPQIDINEATKPNLQRFWPRDSDVSF